jgi:pimeloyl-ACP methyl ester carboxylesterase
MRNILALLVVIICSMSFAQQESETWHARINVMGTTYPLILHLETDMDKSTLDSPDQHAFGMKIDSLSLTGSSFYFFIKNLGFSYKGEKTNDTIIGAYRQLDMAGGLNFSKKPVSKDLFRKPQTPVGPFSYNIEEVTFKNKKGKITLAGTLTTPKDKTDFPIVILASGTGPQNRNGDMVGHSFFWVIADHLTKNGIGVLRYDDRGVGKSEGKQTGSDIFDYASDISAAVKYIKSQKRFKENKLGVIGHSEGGTHSMIAQKGSNKIDFSIFMACIGTSGKEIYIEQHKAIMRSSSSTEEEITAQANFIEGVIDLTAKKDNEDAIIKLLKKRYQSLKISEPQMKITEQQFVDYFLNFANNDWFRSLMAFDADKYLKKVKKPFLAMHGSKDIQVDPGSNFAAFSKAMKNKKAHPLSNAKLYLGDNHLFQNCETCTIAEYGHLSETISKHALMDLSRWIHSITEAK